MVSNKCSRKCGNCRFIDIDSSQYGLAVGRGERMYLCMVDVPLFDVPYSICLGDAGIAKQLINAHRRLVLPSDGHGCKFFENATSVENKSSLPSQQLNGRIIE